MEEILLLYVENGEDMNVYEVLSRLDIDYEEIEHQAIYTVEEAKRCENMLDGLGCKNLFLTDKKGNYYLYILKDDKRADLKEFALKLKVLRLTFGSEEDLKKLLGLSKGSVTPLGIINDKDNKVVLVFDNEIVGERILCHPNVNTKTISINWDDLIKIVLYFNHQYIIY